VGTPFNDSLTPKQREIKDASSKVRRNIFSTGVSISCVALLIIRPFNEC